MKKLILAFIVIFGIGAIGSFAQTRKHSGRVSQRRIVRKTVIKTVRSASVTTASGLTYLITHHGTGAKLKNGDKVIINYTGLLTDGTKFESSVDGGRPFSFPLGAGRVIQGWDEGIAKLRVGDRAILYIPSSLGYGADGAGETIPPNAELIFIVEVMGVQ